MMNNNVGVRQSAQKRLTRSLLTGNIVEKADNFRRRNPVLFGIVSSSVSGVRYLLDKSSLEEVGFGENGIVRGRIHSLYQFAKLTNRIECRLICCKISGMV